MTTTAFFQEEHTGAMSGKMIAEVFNTFKIASTKIAKSFF